MFAVCCIEFARIIIIESMTCIASACAMSWAFRDVDNVAEISPIISPA
jgi:hypothetical protein